MDKLNNADKKGVANRFGWNALYYAVFFLFLCSVASLFRNFAPEDNFASSLAEELRLRNAKSASGFESNLYLDTAKYANEWCEFDDNAHISEELNDAEFDSLYDWLYDNVYSKYSDNVSNAEYKIAVLYMVNAAGAFEDADDFKAKINAYAAENSLYADMLNCAYPYNAANEHLYDLSCKINANAVTEEDFNDLYALFKETNENVSADNVNSFLKNLSGNENVDDATLIAAWSAAKDSFDFEDMADINDLRDNLDLNETYTKSIEYNKDTGEVRIVEGRYGK